MCRLTRQSPYISTLVAMSYFIGMHITQRKRYLKQKRTIETIERNCRRGRKGDSEREKLMKKGETPCPLPLISVVNEKV